MHSVQEALFHVDDQLHQAANQALDAAKPLIGRTAKLEYGQYVGRYGLITSTSISYVYRFGSYNLHFLIHPYRKDSRGTIYPDLLNDRPDARTYWPIWKFTVVPTLDEYYEEWLKSDKHLIRETADTQWNRMYGKLWPVLNRKVYGKP